MHPLVRRQLRKAFGDAVPDTTELRAFIAAVDDAYAASDADRKQLEHSLELASDELFERNTKLEGQLDELRRLDRVVAQRNHDMARILDNVAQGLVTVDLDGAMSGEHSLALVRWFGEPAPSGRIWTYLAGHDPNLEVWIELGFDTLRGGDLPADLVIEQLPSRIDRHGRQFHVEYQPIGDPVTTILVMVSDVTEELARQRAERAQRELIAVVEKAYRDRAGFLAFIHDTDELVRGSEAGWDGALADLERLLHTLKGNAAMFGVVSVAEVCHELESVIEETGAPPDAAGRGRLLETWRSFHARVDRLLGVSARRTILVDWDEYQAVLALLGDPEPAWASRIRRWGDEATRAHLERFAEQARELAHRLGKAELDIELEDHDLRLDGQRFAPVWSTLIHSVRNAIAHGIETASARRAAGKPERGAIRMSTTVRGDELWIEIEDDGAGIVWSEVAKRAAALGLPVETPHDLAEAVFANGVSTASQLTQDAGRGVGMSALRATCGELGGSVELASAPGQGTMVRCRIPLSPAPRRRPSRLSSISL